jgi:PAS domain S-box-containing protein
MGEGTHSWRPRRLQHQMLALLAVMMVVAMALLYQFFAARLDESAGRVAEERAHSVAQAAVRAGAAGFEAGDGEHLERALTDLARLPGVIRIDAIADGGAVLASLQVAPHGAVLRGRDPTDLRPPRPGEPVTQRVQLGGADALRVWTSVGPAARHGTVAVTYSLASEMDLVERLRYEALLAFGAVGALAIAMVYGFMTRVLAPLKRLVHFANDLAHHTGRQIDWAHGSREVDDLAAALNRASATLREQLDAIRRNDDRTAAILNVAPDATLGLDEDGRVTLVNPAVTSVLGCDPEHIIGQPIGRLLRAIAEGEAERLTLAGLYVRSSHSHVARLETAARRHDGSEFPAEVSLARVETPEGAR